MAAGFGHLWQGTTLGSLPRAELLEIAVLLEGLLERVGDQRMFPPGTFEAAAMPDLILCVWRLDLRLQKHRPLAPPNRTAQGKPIPLISTWNRSPRPTAPPPTAFTASGTADASEGGWWIGPPTRWRGE